jgi:hypothetical protein
LSMAAFHLLRRWNRRVRSVGASRRTRGYWPKTVVQEGWPPSETISGKYLRGPGSVLIHTQGAISGAFRLADSAVRRAD